MQRSVVLILYEVPSLYCCLDYYSCRYILMIWVIMLCMEAKLKLSPTGWQNPPTSSCQEKSDGRSVNIPLLECRNQLVTEGCFVQFLCDSLARKTGEVVIRWTANSGEEQRDEGDNGCLLPNLTLEKMVGFYTWFNNSLFKSNNWLSFHSTRHQN